MEFDLSNIKYSNNDLKSNIIIPKRMTLELAEFLGIMVGDGHIGCYGSHRQITICGNILDKNYYEYYVNDLIYNIFNIKFNVHFQNSRNAILVRKDSKAIFSFLEGTIGLPFVKNSIDIPLCILNSSMEVKASFVRGLADSDFCLTIKYKANPYPVIHGTSKSRALIIQVANILTEFGIKNNIQTEISYYKKRDKYYTHHRVYINGFERVKKFMDIIGFANRNKVKIYENL